MHTNPLLAAVEDPPVAEAKAWIAGRTFPPDRPLLDVSQAVPSYPPAEALREHLATVVRGPDAAAYTPAVGLPATRDAIAARTNASYGAAVTPDDVVVTAGCNQAFCLAMGALAAPGDEVVLVVPHYFNHAMWLRAQGIHPIPVAADPDAGLVPDPERIAAAIGPRTRAVVLVTPNNPAGVEYPPAVISACATVARDRGVALVLDETYRDFRAGDGPPHDLLAEPGWADTVVQLMSYSKVFSLAGYRVGSIVAGAPVRREVVKLLDCMTICAPRIAQEAVTFGLAALDGWVADRRAEMLGRVGTFGSALAASGSGWRLLGSGAYFAYLAHPFGAEPGRSVARRLADTEHLLTIPGDCFGPGQDGALRLAFGNVAVDAVPAVVDRLAGAAA